jgi:hypothetical protein
VGTGKTYDLDAGMGVYVQSGADEDVNIDKNSVVG